MKHMHELKGRPRWFDEPFFVTLFERSSMCKLTGVQLQEYIQAMTTERDVQNQIDFALQKGLKQGEEIGKEIGKEIGVNQARQNVARVMMQKGFSVRDIADCTGLAEDVILSLNE